jgi:uncharacterized protein (DUF983 family)
MDEFGKGPFGTKLHIAAQVTNGVCPTCAMEGVFVSLTPEIYRCITCGTDCRQYINGSIKYLPAITKVPESPLNGHKT